MKTIVQEIKNIIEDARQIESATGYGECLYHQNRGDSSVRRYKRMVFVKQAEAEFIKANKKEILKNAAKLCRESIGDISELITLKQPDTVEIPDEKAESAVNGKICNTCKGNGEWVDVEFREITICPDCNGTGIISKTCHDNKESQ